MIAREDWTRPRYFEVKMNMMIVVEMKKKEQELNQVLKELDKDIEELEKEFYADKQRIYPFTYEEFNEELKKTLK